MIFFNLKMTLYNKDCNEIMPTLQKESFDALITDPPYGLMNKASTNKRKNKNITQLENWDTLSYDWLPKAIELLKPNSNIVIFTDWMKITDLCNKLKECNCIPKDLFRFEKTRPTNPMTAKFRFAADCEYAIWAVKGETTNYTFNLGVQKWIRPRVKSGLTKSEYPYGKHPAQKPRRVSSTLIEILTNTGDKILDPFCGSASFGVTALLLKRDYVGIEKDEKYFQIAQKNIEDIKNEINQKNISDEPESEPASEKTENTAVNTKPRKVNKKVK